jgi:hypothetical protein
MPFGKKKDPTGRADIDFDRVWRDAIEPAVRDAGLEPVRADEERTGGVIHITMLERLLLCEFAVADLSTANPNVFYELGIRHAVRPRTTVTVFAEHHTLPFDVKLLRSLPYSLGETNDFGPDQAKALREALTARLRDLRDLADQEAVDSPVFQLLRDFPAPDLAHLRTDAFRDRLDYSVRTKQRLADARTLPRAEAVAALEAIEAEMDRLDGVEVGVVIDLYLSYRAASAWDRMIALFDRMPEGLKRVTVAREQLAFALNRRAAKGGATAAADRQRAIGVLESVERDVGVNPETAGLKGRIYKDLWEERLAAGAKAEAAGWLRKAIETYVAGFEADWRDFYPGVNAVTLLHAEGSPASLERMQRLLPLVRYAVEQRIHRGGAGYWEHATLLELSVLEQDAAAAATHLVDALAAVREPWEPETTARNLALIRARAPGDLDWVDDLVAALRERAGA